MIIQAEERLRREIVDARVLMSFMVAIMRKAGSK